MIRWSLSAAKACWGLFRLKCSPDSLSQLPAQRSPSLHLSQKSTATCATSPSSPPATTRALHLPGFLPPPCPASSGRNSSPTRLGKDPPVSVSSGPATGLLSYLASGVPPHRLSLCSGTPPSASQPVVPETQCLHLLLFPLNTCLN